MLCTTLSMDSSAQLRNGIVLFLIIVISNYSAELLTKSNATSDLSSIAQPNPALAFFVIGDSTVSNNNLSGTSARADCPPYGRDFDTHLPTGRFSNGRIVVDFLAENLGLQLVPTFLGGRIEDMLEGGNYASADAAISLSNVSESQISLKQQLQQLNQTFSEFKKLLMTQDAWAEYISQSVFYLSVGTNDYIHYFLPNVSNVQNSYSPWTFSKLLAHTMEEAITFLSDQNVRNVVVSGLPPIGCAPFYLAQNKSVDGNCVSPINDMMLDFNVLTQSMLKKLRIQLKDTNFIFCDIYLGLMDIIKNPENYGINVTTDACCGSGMYNGSSECGSPEMACTNASNYVWWDQFHPTDAVNKILAENAWSSLHTEMCSRNVSDILSPKSK